MMMMLCEAGASPPGRGYIKWREKMQKIILALDIATKTGWACNHPEQSGVENFAIRRDESPGMRFVRFEIWLNDILKQINPDIVVFEQAHHRNGATTECLLGLITTMLKVCAERKINHISYHTATIKKHATGRGNAKKPDMMQAFREKWGREPIDDNHCDACFILDLAIKELC
jgi:Holliday junction resolvasome RuvABC endonuclease subunit